MPLAARELLAVSDAQLELLFDAPVPIAAAIAGESRSAESAPQEQSGITTTTGGQRTRWGRAGRGYSCDLPRGGEAGLLSGRL